MEGGARVSYLEKRKARTRRSRARHESQLGPNMTKQTRGANLWRRLAALRCSRSSSPTQPTSCTRTLWTTDADSNGYVSPTKGKAIAEENNSSGESFSTSSATASPHQHPLIDLRFLLCVPIRCNIHLRDRWLASTTLKLVVATNTLVPNSISARVINGIPGCDIAFGARCIYRIVTSRLGVGKRAREEGA